MNENKNKNQPFSDQTCMNKYNQVWIPNKLPRENTSADETIITIRKFIFYSNLLQVKFTAESIKKQETIRHPKHELSKKFQNILWFLYPIQLPTQGQWWSILNTHVLQIEQWCERGGLKEVQLKQYLHSHNPRVDSEN